MFSSVFRDGKSVTDGQTVGRSFCIAQKSVGDRQDTSGGWSGGGVASGIAGGANWSPSAYDEKRELFLVGVVHLHTRYIAHDVCGADSGVIQYASTRNNAVA